MNKLFAFLLAAIVSLGFMFTAPSRTLKTGNFEIDTLASGLSVPWDILFLPGGELLFSERPGRVRVFRNNQLEPKPALVIADIMAQGKMGLLGMCLHPAFAQNHFLYLAYNYKEGNKTFLRIARYKWGKDTLTDAKTIVEHIPGVFNHTGSRLQFGPDRKLYISTGDADVPVEAQDLKMYNGKILRLNDDGAIPADNPFVHNDTALHEIWSYGHRNPQGLVFQPGTGLLFSSEHGPTGGDEINLIRKGQNYGWPVIHHRDVKQGMMSPLMEFSPSIGPAEALFYKGNAFPSLKGHLLVGCMRGEAILNVSFRNKSISSYTFLLKNTFGRIRALAEGPDGYLYISTSQVDPPESNLDPKENGFDLLLRIRPGKGNGGSAPVYTTAINNTLPVATGEKRTAAVLYAQLCASCHGAGMEGKDKTPSLKDAQWLNGGSKEAIVKSITQGIIAKGMPAWKGVMSSAEIESMADYILAAKK